MFASNAGCPPDGINRWAARRGRATPIVITSRTTRAREALQAMRCTSTGWREALHLRRWTTSEVCECGDDIRCMYSAACTFIWFGLWAGESHLSGAPARVTGASRLPRVSCRRCGRIPASMSDGRDVRRLRDRGRVTGVGRPAGPPPSGVELGPRLPFLRGTGVRPSPAGADVSGQPRRVSRPRVPAGSGPAGGRGAAPRAPAGVPIGNGPPRLRSPPAPGPDRPDRHHRDRYPDPVRTRLNGNGQQARKPGHYGHRQAPLIQVHQIRDELTKCAHDLPRLALVLHHHGRQQQREGARLGYRLRSTQDHRQ